MSMKMANKYLPIVLFPKLKVSLNSIKHPPLKTRKEE
jgi:hypothetical protein